MKHEFTSQIAMISYFKGLEGADFRKLLADEFGVQAPDCSVPQYQTEYLYKYMVQGANFKYLTGHKLIDYAFAATENLVRIQPALKLKGEPIVSDRPAKPTKTGRTRVTRTCVADGALFLEHRQVWVGYLGGKIQCTKKTQEAVVAFLTAKFGA